MSDVFADTSFFVALLHGADRHHARADDIASARTDRLVTTVWVLAELGNFLRKPAWRPAFVNILAGLRRDSTALIIPADQRFFDAGVQLFSTRPDQDWSLTDCISMEVLRDMRIDRVLTADRHFVQAGFRALLLEDA
jgi:predicted nucleic acid-binding protein